MTQSVEYGRTCSIAVSQHFDGKVVLLEVEGDMWILGKPMTWNPRTFGKLKDQLSHSCANWLTSSFAPL